MTIADIKKLIKDQFIWDGRIIASDINVNVKDGTVELTGEVPTYSSKIAAEEDALSIIGVLRVENNLKVKYPEPDFISDEDIKSAIIDKISLDHRIESKYISVSVEKGVVSFTGSVDAYWKKDVILEYAYRNIGVVGVVEEIEVIPHSDISDEKIAEDIKSAFERNGFIGSNQIFVEVYNSEVTIEGTVTYYTSRIKAREIAYYTTGVRNVKDKISIREKLPVS
ncbi:MAG: BON domain-containing protein [Bacteroidetes bacterium]|nr:BON domain-containing protein [Bacteroidota bacterium]HET6244080.1 BON domain-containing protein [Bacteroidia bacterium]